MNTDVAEPEYPFENPTNGDDMARGPRATIKRVIVGIIVLISFGVWGYAYSGLADRPAPDILDDATFSETAEPICARAKTEVDAIPSALKAEDNLERADQVDTANRIYAAMLADLAAEATGSERDLGIIDLWLNRWQIILADREDYAERLLSDPDAQFYISAEAGRRAEKSISYVADVNSMPSCGAPTDVG